MSQKGLLSCFSSMYHFHMFMCMFYTIVIQKQLLVRIHQNNACLMQTHFKWLPMAILLEPNMGNILQLTVRSRILFNTNLSISSLVVVFFSYGCVHVLPVHDWCEGKVKHLSQHSYIYIYIYYTFNYLLPVQISEKS